MFKSALSNNNFNRIMHNSSSEVNNDVMKELSRDNLNSFLITLKQHLPKHIRPHNYIFNYLLHYDRINQSRTKIHPRWNMKFYGNRFGRQQNCTFVTITAKDDYYITAFTLEEDALELKDCLVKTDLIDWNHTPLILAVDHAHSNLVEEIFKTKCNNWKYDEPEFIMHIAKEAVLKLPLTKLPNNIYISNLSSKYAKFINAHWSYRYHNSDVLIKESLEYNGGSGIFKHGDEMPIAWIGTCDFFTPGFLHTIPSERRKGYASATLIHELKRLVNEHNVDIFTFVGTSNEASKEMHRKLGFTVVNTVAWFEK